MDHDEVRQYPGWHHHMLICMLAHFFLWHVKIRLGEKSPGLDPAPEADVIGGGLTLTAIDDGRGDRVGRLGPTAPSSGVFVAQKAAGDRGLNQTTL